MPETIVLILAATGLAILFGLVVADVIETARYHRAVKVRISAKDPS